MAAAIGPIRASGRGPGEHRPAVVLGDPVAVIAEPVGEPRQVDRVAQRLRARRALGDGGLVEDREAEGWGGHLVLTYAERPTAPTAPLQAHAPDAADTPDAVHAGDAPHAREAADVAEAGHHGGAPDHAGAQHGRRAADHPRARDGARAGDRPGARDRPRGADRSGARDRGGAADHGEAPGGARSSRFEWPREDRHTRRR